MFVPDVGRTGFGPSRGAWKNPPAVHPLPGCKADAAALGSSLPLRRPGEPRLSTTEPQKSEAPSKRLATYFHVHLVSDSTGETLNAMAKAVVARFEGVIPIEHIYALIRSPTQLERVLEEI